MVELNNYVDHDKYFGLNQKITTEAQKNQLDLINKKRTKLNRDMNDKLSPHYRPWLGKKTYYIHPL